MVSSRSTAKRRVIGYGEINLIPVSNYANPFFLLFSSNSSEIRAWKNLTLALLKEDTLTIFINSINDIEMRGKR